jgi:hypothetical protein
MTEPEKSSLLQKAMQRVSSDEKTVTEKLKIH